MGQAQEKTSKGFVMDKVEKTDKEWQACLTPQEYQILREKGTEMAFTGKYYKHKEAGTYTCAGCDNKLFSSVVIDVTVSLSKSLEYSTFDAV